MRKQFLLLLTALLTLGAASVKAATVTVEFGKANFINNGGSAITQGEITITPECQTAYAIGTKIDANNGMTVANTANNLITRVVLHVSDNTGGGANQILPSSFPPDRVEYDGDNQLLTISNIELFDLLIKTWTNENDYNFYIDSMAVTYEEVDGTVIRLSAIPESDEGEGTAVNVTVHSNAYYSIGPAMVHNNNDYYIYIKTTESAVPEIRGHIHGGTDDGKAGLTVSSGSINIEGNWANITGASTDSISITTSGQDAYVYFDYFVLPADPSFTDFELDFRTDPYSVSGTMPTGTNIAGTYHDNQHGYQNVEATIPMEAGTYRLTLGACQYGNGEGNVMSETNIELASFNQNLGENKCYHQNPAENIISMIFDVDQDQHITIDCGNYTPYMKLEAVTSYQVSFALSDAEGVAPAAADVTIGEALTMPVNKTMYKDGYTLTGWSDGANTYAIGAAFTPATDAVLTPVFTANEADLLNASTDVTVKWYFGGDNGAPVMKLEGSAGLLVAQATIGDKTVDVKLAIDATSGKFEPQPTTEWAQVKVGTIFTYPYKEGMTVKVGNYKSYVTYYIADAEGKVACGENDYYSFIQVTYPKAVDPTAIENVQTNHVQAIKFLRDGMLLIEKNGKTYNAQGAEVK